MRAKEFIAFVEKGETYDIKREPYREFILSLVIILVKLFILACILLRNWLLGYWSKQMRSKRSYFRRTFRINQGTTCNSDRPCLAWGPFGYFWSEEVWGCQEASCSIWWSVYRTSGLRVSTILQSVSHSRRYGGWYFILHSAFCVLTSVDITSCLWYIWYRFAARWTWRKPPAGLFFWREKELCKRNLS